MLKTIGTVRSYPAPYLPLCTLLLTEIVNAHKIFNLWCSRHAFYGIGTNRPFCSVASAAGDFVFKAFVAF